VGQSLDLFSAVSPEGAWTVTQVSLEDMVLGYMSQAADPDHGRKPLLEVAR